MSGIPRPTRNPIRYLNGQGWQVLHDLPHAWVDCESHEDALLIAEAEQLCSDVFAGRACSEAAATRLDDMAEAVVRNIGSGVLVRYIQHAAKRVRDASA